MTARRPLMLRAAAMLHRITARGAPRISYRSEALKALGAAVERPA